MRILILGVSGMLGHTLFTELSKNDTLNVFGTVRTSRGLSQWFSPSLLEKVRSDVDGDNFDTVIRSFAAIQPEVVINCIGLIKQLPMASDPLTAIAVNAQLPHRISLVCRTAGARLVHVSTDCIFKGDKGGYTEKDNSDAVDLYGRTKYLGEVEYPHCITLRTSIIGHELKGKYGLIEWFLSQEGKVKGFTKAIYSGFPTIEIANIIIKHIIPDTTLSGLYQVSSDPISKYDFLKLVAKRYDKKIEIIPTDELRIDRSLDSTIFRNKTGYTPPSWPDLVDRMYKHFIMSPHYKK